MGKGIQERVVLMLEKWCNGRKIKVQELDKTVKESKRNSPNTSDELEMLKSSKYKN